MKYALELNERIVMVKSTHIHNDHNSATVTPRELLEIGLDPAVLWNVDRDKKINSQIFIVSTLRNGYSEHIISKLVEYFDKEMILDSLNQYRDRVSDRLFQTVESYLQDPQHAA